MVLWILPGFKEEGQEPNFTAQVTLHKDKGTTSRLPKWGEEQIFVYVKAVSFFLSKSYATGSNIAKETSDIACLEKTPIETSVQFADVFRSKVVCRESSYPEESTKGVFIDGIPANIQGVVVLFWSCEHDAHLLEFAQNADTLLEQVRQVLSSLIATAQKNRLLNDRQAAPILAALAKQRSRSWRKIHYLKQTAKEGPLLNKEAVKATKGPNKRRIVGRVWQKATEKRRCHIPFTPRSLHRKERLIVNKRFALVYGETTVKDSTAHLATPRRNIINDTTLFEDVQQSWRDYRQTTPSGTVDSEAQPRSRNFLQQETLTRLNDDIDGVHASGNDEIPTPIIGGARPDIPSEQRSDKKKNSIESWS